MLKVILRDDEERKFEPRTIMMVEHNGKVIEEFWDGGEPEDQSFCRDWGWVPGMIEKAYKLGVRDTQKNMNKEFNRGWDVGYDFATNPDKEDLRKKVEELESRK